MRLGAVQLVQSSETAFSLRGLGARVGRIVLLYVAIASLGATLTLFSFLLTSNNLVLAIFGLLAGLGLVHALTLLIDITTALVREISRQLDELGRTWAKVCCVWFNRDARRAFRDEVHLLVRYAGVLATIMVVYFALHEVVVLRWSSLTGFYVGVALVVIVRIIFDGDVIGVRRRRSPRSDR